MASIRTILHPTDFSPCADLALRFAGSLARDLGARLVVLHVGQPPLYALESPIPATPLPVEWRREELEQQLRQRTVPDLGSGPEYRLEYADRVSDEILRVADETRCDLIVLGTHGRTGLSRLLVGSVAEHVMRRASCPVLTVRHLPPGGGAPSQ
jgi:nucleotide-binding universal stress UspA family protein